MTTAMRALIARARLILIIEEMRQQQRTKK